MAMTESDHTHTRAEQIGRRLGQSCFPSGGAQEEAPSLHVGGRVTLAPLSWAVAKFAAADVERSLGFQTIAKGNRFAFDPHGVLDRDDGPRLAGSSQSNNRYPCVVDADGPDRGLSCLPL
jgi:hypothetical protein